jgi:hypothetical protein
MRKWRRLYLACAFSLVLGAIALALWLHRPPRITEAAYEQINVGQTLAEVEATIGRPPGNHFGTEMQEYLPRSLLSHPNFAVVVADGRAHRLLTDEITDGFMPNQSTGLSIRSLKSVDDFRATPPPVRKVLWLGPQCAIAVQLDADDRVVNACLAKNFREPGPFERLLARIGIK